MITYRDANPATDAAVLGGIARATFIETFGHLYSRDDLATFLAEGSDAAYAAELADPQISVRFAEAGGTPIGFAKLGPPKLPVDAAGVASAELRQLYVFKPWHGTEVARTLMDWALAAARARGAAALWLTVFTDNQRARAFYRRLGFVEMGPYRFMVGAHADEDIICRLALP